jgi:hypothetical protein
VLRENNMPIEILRAKLKREKLAINRKATWRFKG